MSAMKASRTEAMTTVVISSRVGEEIVFGSLAASAAPPRSRPRLRGAATAGCGLLRREVKVRDLPKEIEARFDLLARHALQPLGPKALDRERAHDAAVKHRFAEDRGS